MVPTRATKAIIIIIIAILGGCVLSACHSWWSVLIVLAAMIGGMVVFLGLWIEKEAEEDENGIHLFAATKRKSKWGWRILMIGIGIEVLLGASIAIYEARVSWRLSTHEEQTRQMVVIATNNIANLNPRNSPISSIFARFSFSENEIGSPGLSRSADSHKLDKLVLCNSTNSKYRFVFSTASADMPFKWTDPGVEKAFSIIFQFDNVTMVYPGNRIVPGDMLSPEQFFARDVLVREIEDGCDSASLKLFANLNGARISNCRVTFVFNPGNGQEEKTFPMRLQNTNGVPLDFVCFPK